MSVPRFSRRDFLKTAGIALGASALTCSGLGYVATRTPAIETPELSYAKDQTMNNRLLVTYATRAGSTAEIAAALGEALAQRGFSVEVVPVRNKPNPADYQAVILGSAIRMGSWLPEAVEFIQSNQVALNQMPVALFTVHMLNTGEDEASCAARLAYLANVHPLLNQAEEIYFTGKMDFSRLSFLDRFVAGLVKAVESDQRDWNKIRNWTPAFLA
jgi:menaquinone-dependent protoporphyrinogen oxidase